MPTPQLDGIIPQQNLEILRNKIAEILATELANQVVLNPDAPKVKDVWLERFIAFDENTELPAVNVCFSQSSFSNQTQVKTQGLNTFVIDVYTNATATREGTKVLYGDKKAMLEMTRILGMIRTILSAPVYKTLGITTGIVSHSMVERMYIGDKSTAVDALSGVVGRVIYTISALENWQLQPSVALELSTITVLLAESDKGFKIEIPTV